MEVAAARTEPIANPNFYWNYPSMLLERPRTKLGPFFFSIFDRPYLVRCFFLAKSRTLFVLLPALLPL
jgi:hypothetical protein